MKKLIYKEGNLLLANDVQVIGHQANCQNTFGSGIARSIKEMYPDAYTVDTMCAVKKANTLGNFSMAEIPVEQRNKHNTNIRYIFNLYGQDLYGKGIRQTNYEALYSALEKMASTLSHGDYVDILLKKEPMAVGFPFQMGSFRGGGSWDIVSRLIEVAFDDYAGDVIIYRLNAN